METRNREQWHPTPPPETHSHRNTLSVSASRKDEKEWGISRCKTLRTGNRGVSVPRQRIEIVADRFFRPALSLVLAQCKVFFFAVRALLVSNQVSLCFLLLPRLCLFLHWYQESCMYKSLVCRLVRSFARSWAADLPSIMAHGSNSSAPDSHTSPHQTARGPAGHFVCPLPGLAHEKNNLQA